MSSQATSPSAAEVVEALTATAPWPVSNIVRADLPAASGLYAWWLPPSVMPDLLRDESHTASVREDVALLYVGISGDLQQRIWRNHVNGNTGGSTLRRTLAALLTPTLQLSAERPPSSDRAVLTKPSEAVLTQWIKRNLSLTCVTHPAPKVVEGEVIRDMKPPCNLDHNSGHPNYGFMSSARAAWRASACS